MDLSSFPNVELGHRLLIATDQYDIIHDCKIMQGGDEAAEVAPLADRLVGKLGLDGLASLSFDRGFSSINSLEHHGLDRCPDKGYQAYARYAALGILAYNLHRIGNHLIDAQRRADGLARAA